MIELVTIKDINVTAGISKTGKGYNMVKIETEDGRKMSMYIDKEFDQKLGKLKRTQDWQAGVTVTVNVEENGQYLNFDIPSKNDILEQRVSDLAERVLDLERSRSGMTLDLKSYMQKVDELERVIDNAKKAKQKEPNS